MSNANGIDSHLKGLVDDTLRDFIKKGRMFTAFDVTKAVRTTIGPGRHVFHEVIRQYVHDYWEQFACIFGGLYARTTIPIGSATPLCYYIPGKHDPSTYRPDDLSPAASASKSTASKPTGGQRVPSANAKPIIATFGGIRRSDC